jgi:thiosulfate reductase cytochrome b subunit
VISSLLGRHFRTNLLPAGAGLTWRALSKDLASHLRFQRPDEAEAWSYNLLQRITYLLVIFVLFPLAIWTGLAMSPSIVSVFPTLATGVGGQQSARTIHFFVSVLLVLFLLVHIAMVWRAGFRNRMRAMITSRAASRKERP